MKHGRLNSYPRISGRGSCSIRLLLEMKELCVVMQTSSFGVFLSNDVTALQESLSFMVLITAVSTTSNPETLRVTNSMNVASARCLRAASRWCGP